MVGFPLPNTIQLTSLNLHSEISTYAGRGVTGSGINAAEHTAVYLDGTEPTVYQAEVGNGMTKEPLLIRPAGLDQQLHPVSRLRFGKTVSIEFNAKVREIGIIVQRDLARLLRYYKEAQEKDFDAIDIDDDDETPQPSGPFAAYSYHEALSGPHAQPSWPNAQYPHEPAQYSGSASAVAYEHQPQRPAEDRPNYSPAQTQPYYSTGEVPSQPHFYG